MRLATLACTGDPLLDQLLGECTSIALLLQPAWERAADVLPLLDEARPALIFVSPALPDAGVLTQVKGSRVCWLAEGGGPEGTCPDPPEGVEVLRAERLTPQVIDAWVRGLQKPAASRPPSPELVKPHSPDAPAAHTPGGQDGPPAAPGARPTLPALPVPPLRTPPARSAPPPPPPPRTPPARTAPHSVPPCPPAPATSASPAGLPPAAAAAVPPQGTGKRAAAPPQGAGAGATPRPHSPASHPAVPRALHPAVRVLRQQVVTLWGSKPGAGRSTIALGLADLLARSGDLRVCTVDLNPYNSSLAPLLGREQDIPSWVHLAEALSRGQPLPESSLHWVRPNWALVSGPDGRPDLVSHVTPEAIAWLVDGLRNHFDYIILDPEARPGPIRDAAARLAQLVLVTVACDYADVLDTARGFEAALEQGVLTRDRCHLVLARWLETPYLTQAEVADCFGLAVAATIPLSPEAALRAAGEGQPVTRLADPGAARLSQALEQLLGVVAPVLASAGAERTRSGPGSPWLAWLSR